jgi:hypothetical protein
MARATRIAWRTADGQRRQTIAASPSRAGRHVGRGDVDDRLHAAAAADDPVDLHQSDSLLGHVRRDHRSHGLDVVGEIHPRQGLRQPARFVADHTLAFFVVVGGDRAG